MPKKTKAKTRTYLPDTRPITPLYHYIQDLRRVVKHAEAIVGMGDGFKHQWVEDHHLARLQTLLEYADADLTLAIVSLPEERCEPSAPPVIRTYRENGLVFRAVLPDGATVAPEETPDDLAIRCDLVIKLT